MATTLDVVTGRNKQLTHAFTSELQHPAFVHEKPKGSDDASDVAGLEKKSGKAAACTFSKVGGSTISRQLRTQKKIT